MEDRKNWLLKTIVELYTETGEPVSSSIVSKFCDWSSATIRNDMAYLEGEGFLAQPHTSAGRIPTIDGYRYYVQHLMGAYEFPQQEHAALRQELRRRHNLAEQAEALADVSQSLVLLSDDSSDIAYSGLGYLFGNADLLDKRVVAELAKRLDRLHDVVSQIHELLGSSKQTVVLIGQDNPFHDTCSVLARSYESPDAKQYVAFVTPLRSNYSQTMALLDIFNDVL